MSQQTPYGPPSGPVPPPGYPQGQPAYGQGAPGHPPTGPQKTNTMAILGLVFAFVFSPMGIVFSAIGLGQVKERGERGRGLAIAGLILSIVLLLLTVVLFVLLIVGFGWAMQTAAEDSQGVEDPAGVLAACETIIPAMLAPESDMAAVTTPGEYAASDAVTDVEDPSYLTDTLTEDGGRVDAACAAVGHSD